MLPSDLSFIYIRYVESFDFRVTRAGNEVPSVVSENERSVVFTAFDNGNVFPAAGRAFAFQRNVALMAAGDAMASSELHKVRDTFSRSTHNAFGDARGIVVEQQVELLLETDVCVWQGWAGSGPRV